MATDCDVLFVLRRELDFLGRGGYRRSAHMPRRAPLIFEDSPTCLSFYREKKSNPCGECPLLRFVPSERRQQKIPCRYIQLSEEGDTLDSLYHYAYESEIENLVGRWIESNIDRLETSALS